MDQFTQGIIQGWALLGGTLAWVGGGLYLWSVVEHGPSWLKGFLLSTFLIGMSILFLTGASYFFAHVRWS